MVATKDACAVAKAVLDPSAEGGIKEENYAKAPSGCSRFLKQWFFNAAKGQADGVSEPVCKLASGQG